MNSDGLEEKVAKALCIAHGDNPDLLIYISETKHSPSWDHYYGHFASAAIDIVLEEAARVVDNMSRVKNKEERERVYNIAAAIRAMKSSA